MNVTLARRIIVVFAAAMSSVVLPSGAAAQIPFDQLPKVFDASVPRDQQISIALSAGPEEV
jgi:hypothetical protein